MKEYGFDRSSQKTHRHAPLARLSMRHPLAEPPWLPSLPQRAGNRNTASGVAGLSLAERCPMLPVIILRTWTQTVAR